LERVRDLFLLGCHTGLRFSDWWKLSRANLNVKDPDNPYFEIVTKKTDQSVIIPLLPDAEEILEKYDYQLPKISAQKFNEYIKEVCELAIGEETFLRIYSEAGQMKNERVAKWTRVSSHAARRSFVTNYWERGMPVSLIMQITGHTTEAQFFEYIDVSPKLAAKEFQARVRKQRSESARNT
jgi:integrase